MALTDYDAYQGLHPIEAIDQAITDIDTVKTYIPSSASAQNKLVTESDIEAIETDIEAKQNELSTAQMAAVNSGATAEIIESIGDKQDALSTAQMAAVNSGITQENVSNFESIDSEVVAARVGLNGVSYSKLKERLDAEMDDLFYKEYISLSYTTTSGTELYQRKTCHIPPNTEILVRLTDESNNYPIHLSFLDASNNKIAVTTDAPIGSNELLLSGGSEYHVTSPSSVKKIDIYLSSSHARNSAGNLLLFRNGSVNHAIAESEDRTELKFETIEGKVYKIANYTTTVSTELYTTVSVAIPHDTDFCININDDNNIGPIHIVFIDSSNQQIDVTTDAPKESNDLLITPGIEYHVSSDTDIAKMSIYLGAASAKTSAGIVNLYRKGILQISEEETNAKISELTGYTFKDIEYSTSSGTELLKEKVLTVDAGTEFFVSLTDPNNIYPTHVVFLDSSGTAINVTTDAPKEANELLISPGTEYSVTSETDIAKVRLYLSSSYAQSSTCKMSIYKKGDIDSIEDQISRNTSDIESMLGSYFEKDISVVAGTSDTYSMNVKFNKGSTIYIGLDCGFCMKKEVGIYYVDSTGQHLLGTASPIHEYVFVAPSDVKKIEIYINKDNYTESATYKMYARAAKEPIHHRVVVKGNTLYQTIKAITDSSISNQYDIILSEREYDVSQEFTEDEINSAEYSANNYNDTFVGLALRDGINIIGNGIAENIIIKCEIPLTYSRSIRNAISTLNPKGYCTVENVTIIGINIRYAVHDDFDYNRNAEQIFKNCRFIEENSTGESAFGCGTASGMSIYMENCYFSKSAGFHSNSNFETGSNVRLVNCTADVIGVGDSDSNVTCKITVDNCKIKKFSYYKSNDPHAQFYQISGSGTNGLQVDVYDETVYSVGDIITAEIDNVSEGDVLDYSNELTSNPDNAYSVVVGYKNGVAYLQRSGYLPSNKIGLASLSVGDYLTIDNGHIATGGTRSNAIAVVTNISNGKAFAKMLI